MKGESDEARVVEAFCAWLESCGWTVSRNVSFCDVVAERGHERLFAEAKGWTTDIGTDLDTAYGQILRRMPLEADHSSFALVVPIKALRATLRVPRRIRDLLRLDIYAVGEDGKVSLQDA